MSKLLIYQLSRLAWLFISFITASSYTFNGYEIRDLNDDSTFAQDSLSWTASNKRTTNLYSVCGTTLLLGGYGVLGTAGSHYNEYFQRVYSNLPTHNTIHFSMTFWAIDSWDLVHNDRFFISFDSVTFTGWTMDLSWFTQQICGVTSPDWREASNIRIFGTVSHQATSLTVRVISGLNEESQNESFGFRDVILIFDQALTTGTNAYCGRAGSVSLPSSVCLCPEGYYYSGGSCLTCHSYCSSCYGGTAADCYECKKTSTIFWDGTQCATCASGCSLCEGSSASQCLGCSSGYSYFSWINQCSISCTYPLVKGTDGSGNSICTSPCSSNNYVYWDRSCSTTCDAPLQKATVLGVVQLCRYPCNPTEYLYWDGSCQQDCWGPLDVRIAKGVQYCDYRCTNSYDYLYWNRSCLSTCKAPFITTTLNGKQFCMPPCDLNQYLYPDNSCQNTCAGNLLPRTTGGVKYCDFPCGSSYLYWNGSCKATCDFPLLQRKELGNIYCDYPTSTSNYLYWDGTSSPNCPAPLTSRSEGTPVRKFCDYQCTEWDYLYWNGSCIGYCSFPLTPVVQNGKRYCTYSCTGADFLYWNGSCKANCNPPLSIRTEVGKSFCDYRSNLVNNFYYWDNSYSASCDSPLTQRFEGITPYVTKYCDFPCVNTLHYLYWNGSCKSSCHSPLTSTTKNSRSFCHYPCALTEYLYYNGSCLPLCDSPFIQKTYGTNKFCYYPCANPTDFYYWNNTCLSSCPAPFQQQTIENLNWCLYPCLAHQFLFTDGSCLETCEFPLTIRMEVGYRYCTNPCGSTQYLLSWNGTCALSCDLPLRVQSGNMCLLPCDNPTQYYHEQTQQCKEECESPSLNSQDLYLRCLPPKIIINYGSLLDLFLDPPTEIGAPSIVVMTPLLEYVRYIDIPMPPRLEKFSKSRARSILSLRFGQRMTEDMKQAFVKSPLPAPFEKTQLLHSNFIVNFWDEATSMTIIITVALLLTIFEQITKAKQSNAFWIVFKKLRIIAKWNFCLVLLITSVGNIILYSSLEFRSLGFGSSFSLLSFELCIVMIGVFSVLLVAIIYLVFSYQLARRGDQLKGEARGREMQDFEENNEGYLFIFKGFRSNNVVNQLFLFFYVIRIALPMLICSYLYTSPLAQTILYTVINLITVIYIISQRPLLRKINHIQLVIMESIALVVNICLLALVTLNSKNAINSHLGSALGDIIICANSCINLLTIIFFVIKVVGGIRAIYMYQKESLENEKTDYLQLIVFFVQQGGLGFEEFYVRRQAAEIFSNPSSLFKDDFPDPLKKKTSSKNSHPTSEKDTKGSKPNKNANYFALLKESPKLNKEIKIETDYSEEQLDTKNFNTSNSPIKFEKVKSNPKADMIYETSFGGMPTLGHEEQEFSLIKLPKPAMELPFRKVSKEKLDEDDMLESKTNRDSEIPYNSRNDITE